MLLTPIPWRTGTQFRELRDLGGWKPMVLSEIAELEPARCFVVRGNTGSGWLGVWDLEPEGSATCLRWTGQLTLHRLGKFLETLIGRQINTQITKQFATLPSSVEGEIAE